MRFIVLFFVLLTACPAFGQSGRTAPTVVPTTGTTVEQPVKQMFDEVNSYLKIKGAEYDAKKVFFSDRLFAKARLEQRQLAARYAATVELRKDLISDDLYYLGMLHWIAENWDGTVTSLRKFVAGDGGEPGRKQTARSITVVVLAKQKKLDEAESLLSEYLKTDPTKLTERARMEGELAKAYQAQKDFVKMAPHAETDYEASKSLLKDASSRARGLDEILDAGMLVYEAYRDVGDRKKAEDSLDEMRRTAAAFQSPSFYYYAVDQKIKYFVETGRKPQAMEFYLTSLISAVKDLSIKEQQSDVIMRLKKREKHYKLLGETAPEMPMVDQWFPGTRKTFADLRGSVILLDFWATWCGPCFDAFPSIIEWHQDHSRDGLMILGVTRYYGTVNGLPTDNPNEINYLKNFRLKERLPYDFVVGKDQSIQMLYGATALPTAVLIDRKGVIRYIESGTSPGRLQQMQEIIIKLLAEK